MLESGVWRLRSDRDRMTYDPYEYDSLEAAPFPPVFRALRGYAKERRLWVGVNLWFGRREPRAEFVTKGIKRGGEPRILVRTRGGPNKVDDVIDSMILAHEMGHHTSHVRGDPSSDLEELLSETPERVMSEGHLLPLPMRYEVIAEEVRAWNYSREDLDRAGFTSWRTFDRWASASVGTYVRGLRL